MPPEPKPDNYHRLPQLAGKRPKETQDGSNAWPLGHPADDPGMVENKDPLSMHVVDRFGQHFHYWWFPRAGGLIAEHSHKYAHGSILLQGKIVVTGDEEREDGSVFVAPDVLFFPAGEKHSIKAISDKVVMLHTYPPGFVPEDAL